MTCPSVKQMGVPPAQLSFSPNPNIISNVFHCLSITKLSHETISASLPVWSIKYNRTWKCTCLGGINEALRSHF